MHVWKVDTRWPFHSNSEQVAKTLKFHSKISNRQVCFFLNFPFLRDEKKDEQEIQNMWTSRNLVYKHIPVVSKHLNTCCLHKQYLKGIVRIVTARHANICEKRLICLLKIATSYCHIRCYVRSPMSSNSPADTYCAKCLGIPQSMFRSAKKKKGYLNKDLQQGQGMIILHTSGKSSKDGHSLVPILNWESRNRKAYILLVAEHRSLAPAMKSDLVSLPHFWKVCFFMKWLVQH